MASYGGGEPFFIKYGYHDFGTGCGANQLVHSPKLSRVLTSAVQSIDAGPKLKPRLDELDIVSILRLLGERRVMALQGGAGELGQYKCRLVNLRVVIAQLHGRCLLAVNCPVCANTAHVIPVNCTDQRALAAYTT